MNTERKGFTKHLNINTVSAGTLAAIFGCTGPALIIIGGAADGGLTHEQTISWLFAVYFFGGLLGIYLALKYRQPIAGAYSIPGAVLVAGALSQFSLNEIAGAYFVAGVIVLLLGITRTIGKIMNWIPVPIVMGMIVGAMIRFGTGMITSIEKAPLIAGVAVLVYLLSVRFIKVIPPILTSFIVSVILVVIMNEFQIQDQQSSFILPQILIPSFSLEAIVSVSIPLAFLVIGAENAQATGVLMAQGYKPPVNVMTIISGIGGMVTSFFGGHNANIAGPMTAICASEEAGKNKEGRYASVVVNGILFSLFGLLAGIVVPFVTALPSVLVGTIAGLAMISVLVNSLQSAFSETKFQVGAFFALIIGMSDISFFNISSPFWALVGGVLVSLLIEPHHFQKEHEDNFDLPEKMDRAISETF
ncbi:benzoate/H(+) symporter BenE family transporter [Aeribacillus composti]|jgi:benzoate membrane transport protein|uniref:benzoate/H(+) symporter BenE family transporter n=1 Tax=Aeribacillus TaxID=1055323 RepID=UPI0007B4E99D|nr:MULTISPECIES: benzoate/H(+) symporter BenE family transporter [Aeribacillus]KZM55857.1 benzoate transporter [Aeribacillus pallidus]MED0652295.1 benzoate/H(+) symporter BenE family transporter [Aeribacillus composti]MED1439801.1 benzoate/H(+) symporter BenE family transporter [Aeribacillus composti]MED4488760.1 benzoate/H(+) symporter BenE family transporter [Aeribacillus pallidus]